MIPTLKLGWLVGTVAGANLLIQMASAHLEPNVLLFAGIQGR